MKEKMKTSKAQLEASKRYLEDKDVLKICFNKGVKNALEEMIPYAKKMYPGFGSRNIKTAQDIIRIAVDLVMNDITLEYGEHIIDEKEGTLLEVCFPNSENCVYSIENIPYNNLEEI